MGIFPFPKFKKRLKWAYASDEQLRKAGVKASYRTKAQVVLAKVESVFENMGGKKKNLKKAILHGKKGQLTGFEDENIITLEGLGGGGISAGAMVAAATAVLTTINKFFKKKKLGDKETTQPAIITPKSEEYSSDSNAISPENIEALVQSGAKILENTDGTKMLKKPAQNTDGTTSYQTLPIKEEKEESSPSENHQEPETIDQKDKNNKPTGFIPFIKNNPLVAFLGVGVLSGLTYLGVKSFKKKDSKPSKSLSGHSNSKSSKSKSKTLKIEKLK
jgi:hypothetical protein